MTRITLRDVPVSLHAVLKERARSHRRSLNQEVITILEKAVNLEEADRRAAMKRIKQRRKSGPATDETPQERKRQMREGLT